MSEPKLTLEQYLRAKCSDKTAISITHLDKLRDGWESDNYRVTVEHGDPRIRADWVWRIYSGAGSEAKAAREFTAMQKLRAAGYPVPEVILLETADSPEERPFILAGYIQGEVMWDLLGQVPADRQARLVDRFCRLFVQLHDLDWKQFDNSLPGSYPLFFIDRSLDEARGVLQSFPEFDGSPFLEWVAVRRKLFACSRPSPVHQDYHPGNILVGANHDAIVIDWTNFAVTDARFDLAWTLVLAHAYGGPEFGASILQGYQRHAGQPVEHIEAFEAIACARRLLDLTVSLTQGAQRMGMNAQAVAAMRASMEAHTRVHRLFVERTGLQIASLLEVFGSPE
jgi:aminoglycoside phosphotransferase (APT) family kinase protein